METFLTEIGKVLGIFGLSWFSFWPAVPAGLALGLQVLIVIATVTVSYISGVAIVLLPGERVKAWVTKRFGRQMESQANDDNSLIRRMWERYGVIGFGLLAPMTVGAQIGALLGLALNIPPQRLLLWMSVGALGWAIVLALLAMVGIESIDNLFNFTSSNFLFTEFMDTFTLSAGSQSPDSHVSCFALLVCKLQDTHS